MWLVFLLSITVLGLTWIEAFKVSTFTSLSTPRGGWVSSIKSKQQSRFNRWNPVVSLRNQVSNSADGELIQRVQDNIKPGSIVVVKYGGHAMENDNLKDAFLDDIASLYRMGIVPVIVHGGGPQIAHALKQMQVESTFVDGLRVTDSKTLDVAQMVLCGSINKDLVRRIGRKANVKGAIGLCGLDSNLLVASIKDPRLGYVGEPEKVNADFIRELLALQIIPVIAPIATNSDGSGSLNVNADTAAGAVAEALKADVFLLLTDIVGVLDKSKTLIPRLPAGDIAGLRADGTISGGMIPKLETASSAISEGVGRVSIMDGRLEHSVLKALSGLDFGTVIY